MAAISAEGSERPDAPLQEKEPAAPTPRRAVVSDVRLALVAYTLMEPNNMRQYGIILKTTAVGQFAKGSRPVLKSFIIF